VRLIGSFLGGFYALYLSGRFGLGTVLVNPSLRPWETLAASAGSVKNRHDGTAFEWTASHAESLKKYANPNSDRDLILLVLQTGDEILDYRISEKALAGSRTIIVEGGNHGFEGFGRHLPEIASFLRKKWLSSCRSESGKYIPDPNQVYFSSLWYDTDRWFQIEKQRR